MLLPKLDRLSALLEGLAPQVSLTITHENGAHASEEHPQAPFLWLHLLTQGSVQLQGLGQSQLISAPALLAWGSDQPYFLGHTSEADQDQQITARTHFAGPLAALFLEEFAEVRIIALSEHEPALNWPVQLIRTELDSPRCGHPALLNRAGDILFIGLLRYLVAHPLAHGSGLFNGLADPRIAKALVAMHKQPGFPWDLAGLAQEAGMSRTAFARTFHVVMRQTPGKYLSSIRLAIAQRMVDLGKGLKEAARTVGYANASALSRALSKSRAASVQERGENSSQLKNSPE